MAESLNLFPCGPSLEAIDQWREQLEAFQSCLGGYFSRSEAKIAAFEYIQTLLCSVERKNSWQMAEAAGHRTPYQFQNLLGRAVWDSEAVCQEIKAYTVEQLNDGASILAVDETGFLKKGSQSVGVQKQYFGLTGQLENCQVGVFLAYVSSKGHSLIDRRLYLPKSWSSDRARCTKAKVPADIEFASKIQLTQQMLEVAYRDGIRPAWFVADEVYSSNGSFWHWLEQDAEQPYVLTVNKKQPTPINFKTYRAEELLKELEPQAWRKISCGKGTKGERQSEWARIELSFIRPEGFKRWFLFRRHLQHPETISYYQVFAPAETSLETMAEVAGQRWRIEECFEFSKDHLGLDEYEVRSWVGWHRHTSLVLAAQAFLAGLRHQLEPLPDLSLPSLFLSPNDRNRLSAFKVTHGRSSD